MIETMAALAKSFCETKLGELVKDVPTDKLDMRALDEPLSLNEKINEVENKIPSRNQELEGKTHPETSVPFEKKTVESV